MPLLEVQRLRAQLDELGPNTQVRRRFHSLPCGILKLRTAIQLDMNSCTSIEMMGIREENPQFRLTWTESQSTYDREDEKLKRQPDTQGGITLIAAFF